MTCSDCEKLKVGDVVIFHDKPTEWVDISLGVPYTICGIGCGGYPYFIDDAMEANYAASIFNQDFWYKVDNEPK